ncbi:DUF3795 domain-containing protein [Sphaerochaeta globosa]|uniref:DUF3795 domain-containing protein n=1 Tax=Sphaerochaeta globosa (strain ATCC BAA-1886 / DSM 22777 / Buddy) TaxID=158189 RepID=F0RZ71_SPHGB|nr:DUF3795 domain-containing protein [Sphaerochaeta globosa]ADY13352.1 hypothetical protein SpiBuddy_1527 [Sphaerochaeta globosa str. Buddy]
MEHEKGFAYCGLACCLCSENASCPGCRNDGCTGNDWCKHYTCCKEQGFSGCWQCPDFPCDTPMFAKERIRAFATFLQRHPESTLLQVLARNEELGVLYHYEGQLIGDYDSLGDEEAILSYLEHSL